MTRRYEQASKEVAGLCLDHAMPDNNDVTVLVLLEVLSKRNATAHSNRVKHERALKASSS